MWWIGAACSAVLLAGCGQSQEDRIRGVVADYHDALSERDAERTCELLGPHADAGTDGQCVPYVAERFDDSGDVDLSHLRALAESGSVTLRGDRATVTRGSDHDISVVRVDGDWKIDKPGATD